MAVTEKVVQNSITAMNSATDKPDLSDNNLSYGLFVTDCLSAKILHRT